MKLLRRYEVLLGSVESEQEEDEPHPGKFLVSTSTRPPFSLAGGQLQKLSKSHSCCSPSPSITPARAESRCLLSDLGEGRGPLQRTMARVSKVDEQRR